MPHPDIIEALNLHAYDDLGGKEDVNGTHIATIAALEIERLRAALKIMFMAWDSIPERDARRYIGLGDDASFPAIPGEIKSVEQARATLNR